MIEILELYHLSRRLAPKLIKTRREQLCLSHKDVSDRAKRKALKPARIEKLEEVAYLDLSQTELGYLEAALHLPAGILSDGLMDILKGFTQPDQVTASEVLSSLDDDGPNENDENAIIGCNKCYKSIKYVASRYGLPNPIIRSTDSSCLCEGTASSYGADSKILFRLSIFLSGAKRVLILGGGQDVEDIAKLVRFSKIVVIRGKKAGSSPKEIVEGSDIIVLARGEVGHSATASYLNAIEVLPEDKRPIFLQPRSSNITAISEEILWNFQS